jgi:hypothetical protein
VSGAHAGIAREAHDETGRIFPKRVELSAGPVVERPP